MSRRAKAGTASDVEDGEMAGLEDTEKGGEKVRNSWGLYT